MADVSPDASIDPRAYRDVIGRFATGVTVVTVDAAGERHGMTANAVASLSLDPTMILVCVDHQATIHELFAVADAFAVNILAEDQRAMSDFFARHVEGGVDPLGGYAATPSALGAPILEGVLAWLECTVAERYEGGDHTIVVGRVESLSLARPEAAPLLFYAGRYRVLGEPL